MNLIPPNKYHERAEIVSDLLERLFARESVDCREMLRQALMEQPLGVLQKIQADALAARPRIDQRKSDRC